MKTSTFTSMCSFVEPALFLFKLSFLPLGSTLVELLGIVASYCFTNLISSSVLDQASVCFQRRQHTKFAGAVLSLVIPQYSDRIEFNFQGIEKPFVFDTLFLLIFVLV